MNVVMAKYVQQGFQINKRRAYATKENKFVSMVLRP